MSELEQNLNKILEEHQHESGLHVIGGRKRLVDRLVQFFEASSQPPADQPPAAVGRERHN